VKLNEINQKELEFLHSFNFDISVARRHMPAGLVTQKLESKSKILLSNIPPSLLIDNPSTV
jgi:hypothetical protein